MSDIVLVNPPIVDDPSNHPLPYGLWQLGSFIQTRNFTVEILDLNFHWRQTKARFEDLKALILNVDSPIVGFTCMGSNLATALEFAKALKEQRPETIIIFGGPHVSLIGFDLLQSFSFIDYIIVGEGEWTLLEFLQNYKTHSDLDNIQGVLSRMSLFKSRKLMADFNELPLLNLDLINWEKYIPTVGRDFFAFPLLAGSGCPFQCIFCSTSVMWERRFRVKTPEKLVSEMDFIFQETGIRRFDLIHDIFTANKRYLSDFCEQVDGYQFSWHCSSRIDGLTDDLVKKMAQSHCKGIFFGVESGSQRMQQIIGKRLKIDRIRSVLRMCVDNGVDSVCSTVFGFPDETWEDIEETVRLCVDARLMGVGRSNLSLLLSLPGTPIYHGAGLATEIEDRDLQHGSLPIITQQSREWIQNYPNIFSGFYWVEHPSISKNELFSLMLWDKYLASHPATLDHLLKTKRSLAEHISVFSEINLSAEEKPVANLAHYISSLKETSLQELFLEEDLRLKLLSLYQAANEEDKRKYAHWRRDHADLGCLLYVIGEDSTTIQVYHLNSKEISNWRALEDDCLDSQIENPIVVWPVRKIEKEEVWN